MNENDELIPPTGLTRAGPGRATTGPGGPAKVSVTSKAIGEPLTFPLIVTVIGSIDETVSENGVALKVLDDVELDVLLDRESWQLIGDLPLVVVAMASAGSARRAAAIANTHRRFMNELGRSMPHTR